MASDFLLISFQMHIASVHFLGKLVWKSSWNFSKADDKVVEFAETQKPKKAFEEDPDFASLEHSILTELLQSCWYAILAHTDLICYTMVFVNQVWSSSNATLLVFDPDILLQINSSSILSLPLPLMVIMWGTLTFPRPSKTFWVTLIAYTQIIVIIKCVCQYEVLWWNQGVIPANKPFAPPRILGIERKQGYADYDLALLLFVFCHRFILKSLGLWKSDAVDEPLEDGPYTVESTDMATKGLLDTADDE
jgi:piezo-type mechanosensitive ion channel component 1/2